MTKCPECGRLMGKDRREISPGMYAQVEVCPSCADEWVDEKEYRRLRALFRRKAFRIGGSLAVRLPKEITNVVGVNDGEDLSITAKGKRIIIEKIAG